MPSNPNKPRKQMPYSVTDGFVYIRVQRPTSMRDIFIAPDTQTGAKAVNYDDHAKYSRVISAKRVESAVETSDYLDRCREDGASCEYHRGSWCVQHKENAWDVYRGETLREAYHRSVSALEKRIR